MSNQSFVDVQAKARRLLLNCGQLGSIKRPAVPDPSYGGKPVDIWYTARFALMEYDARLVDGSAILSGDVQIYISSAGIPIVPQPGDCVTANGRQYAIINGDPQNHGGDTNAVFVVQARMASLLTFASRQRASDSHHGYQS